MRSLPDPELVLADRAPEKPKSTVPFFETRFVGVCLATVMAACAATLFALTSAVIGG